MLINDIVALLMQIPPVLAGSWGAWFFVGLLLSVWGRKEKARLVVYDGPTPKHKSGVRKPVIKSAPLSSGDAFGELETLLEPQTGTHRTPGEQSSPVLAEVTGSNGATLAAPQSLP